MMRFAFSYEAYNSVSLQQDMPSVFEIYTRQNGVIYDKWHSVTRFVPIKRSFFSLFQI